MVQLGTLAAAVSNAQLAQLDCIKMPNILDNRHCSLNQIPFSTVINRRVREYLSPGLNPLTNLPPFRMRLRCYHLASNYWRGWPSNARFNCFNPLGLSRRVVLQRRALNTAD